MHKKLAIVLIITAVCLVVALWGIELDKAREALESTNWWFLVPMFLLYLVAHSIRSLRLGILVGMPVPFKRIFAINIIGFLAINVIPLRLGEMVRPYLLSEREGVPFARGLAAILMERLLDMLMLLCMLIGLTWLVDLPVDGIQVKGVDVVAAGQRFAGLIVALGVSGVLALLFVGEPVVKLLEKLPMGQRVAEFARKFRDGILALAKRPLRFLWLLMLSATIWIVTFLAVGVVMAAFPGVPVGVAPTWATWTITLSGMTAVPTPGFFGAYELFCSAALWLFEVEPSVAKTFAVVLHLGQLGFTVGLGGFFLVLEGLSLRQLVQPGQPGSSKTGDD